MLKKELQLQVSDSKFWTDSTAVLKYVANNNIRFKTFLTNRGQDLISIKSGAMELHQLTVESSRLHFQATKGKCLHTE